MSASFIVRGSIPSIVLATILGIQSPAAAQPPSPAQSVSPLSNPGIFENLYAGRSSLRAAHNPFTPIVPVANNPTMAINLRR